MVITQIVYGTIPTVLLPYVATVRAAWPGAEYRLVKRPAIADPIERCIASDALRFQMAREIGPDMLYADLDVQIKRKIAIHRGPHFGFRRDQPACFLFHSLTAEFLDKMDKAMKQRGVLGTTYCWPAKVLRDFAVERIPDSSYIHHAYTRNGLAP
jgi:hypothetical protein